MLGTRQDQMGQLLSIQVLLHLQEAVTIELVCVWVDIRDPVPMMGDGDSRDLEDDEIV
jgi:hypothetical protein